MSYRLNTIYGICNHHNLHVRKFGFFGNKSGGYFLGQLTNRGLQETEYGISQLWDLKPPQKNEQLL